MITSQLKRLYTPLISSEEIVSFDRDFERQTLEEILNKESKIIVLGEPGVGKTFELIRIFDLLWEQKESNDSVPILISLKKYHKSFNFEDLIPYSHWKGLSSIIFILDGLDETAYPHDFISVLEIFINKYNSKNYKFLISSRTNIYFNFQLKLDSFKPYKLTPLDAQQINILLAEENIIDVKVDNEFLNKHPFYASPFFLKTLIEFYHENKYWIEEERELWKYYIDSELKTFQHREKKKRKVLIPEEIHRLKLASLTNELRVSNQFSENELFEIFSSSYQYFIDNPFIENLELENKYSFRHRQYQEYFSAIALKELPFTELKSIICIENVKKIRPSLINVVSLLLTLSENTLFDELTAYLIDNNIEIIIKSDSLRLPRKTKDLIFKTYFTSQCIEKTLWIGTNSAISNIDLGQFADSIQSFKFLINVIRDNSLNHRARVSAINLIEEFKSIDENSLLETINHVLNSNASLSYKSTTIRLINVISIEKRIVFLHQIIERNPEESNKEWNRSLIAILDELENIDEFFDYLQREFNWSNKIVLRTDKDEVHRGNSWLMMDLVLRLNNESNFIELAAFYFDDYHLRTHEPFREKLLKKCMDLEKNSPGFIIKLLQKVQKSERIRSYHNDDALVELIKSSNKELDAFKIIYNEESTSDIDSLTLAKITTHETIDYFVSIINPAEAPKVRLQVYRNLIANYGERELAIYLEQQLKGKGIDIEDKVPTEKESKEIQQKLAQKVQENTNLLFSIDNLLKKVETTLESTDSDKINSQILRKLERSFYDEKQNWFRGLGCEFDVLYAATHLFNSLVIDELKEKLNESKWIQITALKGMLESNKNAQFKFELSQKQIQTIREWIHEASRTFDFNNLLVSGSFESFTIKRLSDYRFLKNFYYFLETEMFSESFEQEFLLNSILFYKIEEFDPFSENYIKLLDKINNKDDLKVKVIEFIKSKPISSAMEKLVVCALDKGYTEVYQEIEEFLELSTHSPGDKLFDLYTDKNRDSAIKLIEKIALDLSIYKGWEALQKLSEQESKHVYCIGRCLNYIESGQDEYKSKAMGILFQLNHPSALMYFIEGIDKDPLYNIARKYRTDYYVSDELFMDNFEKLFIPIYQTKEVKDEFDRDWEFSENNTFFTQLITNVLKHSLNTIEVYDRMKQKMIDVQKGSQDDRIIFFANSISELLTNNYINLMSKPMSFKDALTLTDKILTS